MIEPKLIEGRPFVTLTEHKAGPDLILALRPMGRDQAAFTESYLRGENGICVNLPGADDKPVHHHYPPSRIVDVTVFRVNNPRTS